MQEDKIASSTLLTNGTIDDTDIDAENGAEKLGEQGYTNATEAAHEDQKVTDDRCEETDIILIIKNKYFISFISL